MESKIFTPRLIFISSAVLFAAISRLLPHIPNFTPVAAMALFGGAHLKNKKLAFIIPLVAMFTSDLIMELISSNGFHNTFIYVYISFIITSYIGILCSRNIKPINIVTASFASSLLFFIITNFGVWASTGMLNGINGLSTTYVLGIPFFGQTLTGDLFYNIILFGSFYLAQQKFPVLAKA